MDPASLRLLAVLDPAVLGGRDPVWACRRAESGGATSIQVRMKDSPAGEILSMTRRIMEAVSIPVYVNDRADVAWLAGCHGVHLGAGDVPVESVRARSRRPLTIGVSVGDEEEARLARRAGADYWSIGSIYRTASKADAGAAIGPDGFRRLAALAPESTPAIGIGGIDPSNVRPVLAAGARGVAVISAVFAAADIETATRELRRAVDEELVNSDC